MLGATVLLLWGLFLCGAPLALAALHGQRRPCSLVISSAFGMSVGLLFMVTLALGLYPGLKLNLSLVLISSLAPFTAGCVILRRCNMACGSKAHRNPRSILDQAQQTTRSLARGLLGTPAQRVMVALIMLGVVARFLNCFYYPFLDWDVLARYALNAQRIYSTGNIGPSIRGYPLLVPLTYVYTHLVTGGIDEHVAKVIPFLFSIMSVAATYALGLVVFNRHVALLSAFIVLITPLHSDRSCAGHVDIPSSFYFLLAALASYLLWREGRLRHAVLAGFFVGLAISTKQAGFTLFVSIVAYVLLSRLVDKWTHSQDSKLRISHLALVVVTGAAVGLPWYVRNLALGAPPVPLPSRWWLESASPSYQNLLWLYVVYLALVVQGLLRSRRDGVTRAASQLIVGTALVSAAMAWGVLTDARPGVADSTMVGVGLAISLYALANLALQGDRSAANGIVLVLSFVIPYYVAWWYRFSYDTRFLLEILPFIALIPAYVLDDARRFLRPPGRPATILLVVAMCLTALPGIALAFGIDTLGHLVSGPAGDNQKRLQALGPSYRVVLFLKNRLGSPETAGRICITADGRMLYFFESHEANGCLPSAERELDGYRYLVTSPWTAREWESYRDPRAEFLRSLPENDCCSKIFHSDGFRVFEIQ